MKTLKIFEFDKIFNFADKNYDIGWNECNDVFFNNSLQYGKHTTVYPHDWSAYIDLKIIKRDNASDYTKDEIKAMTNTDKSYIILSAYFESLNINDDEVLVDCS